MSRRFGGAGLRRGIRSTRSGGGAAPSLDAQIAAAYAAVGWVTPAIYDIDLSPVALVSGAAERVANLGSGPDLVQSSGPARPTYSATGLASMPALSATGSQWMDTETSIDLTAYSAAALHVLFLDAMTTLGVVASHGSRSTSNTYAIALEVNRDNAGRLAAEHQTTGTTLATVRSLADYPMTSPSVVTSTHDRALSSNEARIRHAGVDVSDDWPTNNNSAGNFGDNLLTIFRRSGVGVNLTGTIAVVVLAAGSGAIPVSTVAAVEALILASRGL